MILRPVRPASPHRSADDEATRRVDVNTFVLLVHEVLLRDHRLVDLDRGCAGLSAMCLMRHVGRVLRRHDHGVAIRAWACRSSYSTVTWVLPSGRSQGSFPLLRTFERPSSSPSCGLKVDRREASMGAGVSFDRVAEHQALVAGPLLLERCPGRPSTPCADVGGLLLDAGRMHAAGLGSRSPSPSSE